MHAIALLPSLLITTFSVSIDVAANPEPKMVQLDQLILEEDFRNSRPLDKNNWKPRQHTQWNIEKGVLRGRPSSAEFQASQNHHQGLEPRLSIPACPDEFAIQFSVRFIGGESTSICPFIEFGHHKARIHWSEQGARLMANGESVQLDRWVNFKMEPGKWYHALAETKGDEFFIQFSQGPVLYGKHPSMTVEKDGFGVAGTRGGQVELDNIKVWSIKKSKAINWSSFRKEFKAMPHKILKSEKAKG